MTPAEALAAATSAAARPSAAAAVPRALAASAGRARWDCEKGSMASLAGGLCQALATARRFTAPRGRGVALPEPLEGVAAAGVLGEVPGAEAGATALGSVGSGPRQALEAEARAGPVSGRASPSKGAMADGGITSAMETVLDPAALCGKDSTKSEATCAVSSASQRRKTEGSSVPRPGPLEPGRSCSPSACTSKGSEGTKMP